MVLETVDFNNTHTTCDVEMYPQEYVKTPVYQPVPQSEFTESDQEFFMFQKILALLPAGYNIPQNADQYDIIMHAIQYINALQSLQSGHF